jgi:hypothetical protein
MFWSLNVLARQEACGGKKSARAAPGRRNEIRCAERTHAMRCRCNGHGGSSHFTSNPYRCHSIDLCFLYDNRAQEGLLKAGVDIPPRETHCERCEVRPAKQGKNARCLLRNVFYVNRTAAVKGNSPRARFRASVA